MRRHVCGWASACALSIALAVMGAVTGPAAAQKSGGILKISFFDSPASMSLHEEATGSALRPMMGVFNNLVVYDQQQAQNRPDTIVPDLAESWSWSEDGKQLTFRLRQGVKWHDGKPFTAADVKCTWELLLGIAPREAARQPAQDLVSEPRKGHDQRRLRGHLSPEAAAAGVPVAARRGLVAGLSLPRAGQATCAPGRSAPARSNSSSSARTR